MRPLTVLAIATLLAPAAMFAASKEQLEMQRDIAQLQQQMQTLQSTLDQKLATIQTLQQQALESANRSNTSVSVLSSSVTQTLERELKTAVAPVAGLAAKVDNTNNDVAEVRSQVSDLNNSMNKVLQLLTDMNNTLKVMQAPAAPPPPSASSAPGAPPPPASVLFNNALTDQNGGKADLALGEYADFLKFYPNDPNGANAQFNIGEIHYAQNKLDLAVQDFDAVIERYPDNTKLTPDAYFMKGMALKQSGRKDAAASTFKALVGKFARSDKAEQAQEQLRAMGYTVPAAPGAAAKRKAR
jgi:TolA-binding protein